MLEAIIRLLASIIAGRHCRSTVWELSVRCLLWPTTGAFAAEAAVATVGADASDAAADAVASGVAAERAASQSHHRHTNHAATPLVLLTNSS